MHFCLKWLALTVVATSFTVGCGGSASGPAEVSSRPSVTAEETQANEDYERQQREAASAYK